VAAGIGRFRFLPPSLSGLPPTLLSHSYDQSDLAPLARRRVVVLGGGASAIDLAGLLHERGCEVQLVCRRESLRFATPPEKRERTLWENLRTPRSGIGPGWRSRLCTDAPLLFHAMPEGFRLRVVQRHLGPGGGWRMKDRIIGHVPVLSGHDLIGAVAKDDHVELSLQTPDHRRTVVSADHVIAATGYRVDIRRLEFLDPALVSRIAHVNESPVLSTRFESSVKGLFFTGPAAANSFGPLMRFAYGAGFASRRVAGALGGRSYSANRLPGNAKTSEPETRATHRS
jgi:hypothetical protein